MSPDMLPWVLARAGGIVAYLLLAGAMLAGLMVRSRVSMPGARPAQLVAAHQQLSLLALAATGVHAAALVADTYVDISPLAVVVPGLVPYRPVWSALGVIALQLLVVVQVSSRLRRRIGVKAWRGLHMLAYGAFALATAHGIAAGTDTTRPWVLAVYAGATGMVAALTGWRVAGARRRSTAPRRVRHDEGVTRPLATEAGRQ
jgi:sulfoxide reductase heme-binding subunit YedZ